MRKIPLFEITPLLESYYINQIGNKKISLKESRSIKKSVKQLEKSIQDPIKWIFIEYQGKQHPVLMKKSLDNHVFLTGPLRLKKAKTEKDLEYWKKELLAILKNILEKSLQEILYPGIMLKSLPVDVQNLLQKARGFAVGTVRTWSGKEYKKMSSGKWVRNYREIESRGAKQAIRNVRGKISEATTMEELLEIVKQNASRFKDNEGKMLPIVKEFISAARGTEAGVKPEPIIEPESETEENKDLPTETSDTDYSAQEKAFKLKNSYTFGDKIEVNGKSGVIKKADFVDSKVLYTVEFEDGTEGQFNNPSLKPFIGVEAQVSIEEANPTNRIEKTMKISGTIEGDKTDEEIISREEVRITQPKYKDMNITLANETKSLEVMDSTVVDQREVLLTPYKSIKEAGTDYISTKPKWMPNIDLAGFVYNTNTLIYEKIEENKYLVPIDQVFVGPGTTFLRVGRDEAELDNFKRDYAVMTLGQVAATQDYYRKVQKAKLDEEYRLTVERYKERGYRKPTKRRLKVLKDNRMTTGQRDMIYAIDPEVNMWTRYRELKKELKQKTIDMDLMREEIDNSYSKGRETAYGDSNTSDALKNEFGVKIKRQDGSNIFPEDQIYLSDAMQNIQKTFGARKSMNEKFGLKLSFAKGTAMHARKAVGLFVPTQHAIGISDGKGLKKKHPITGETIKVDYGDENFGGFVLSHEYAHMMDYYLGGKTGEWYASDNSKGTAAEIASTFRENMNESSKSDYINRTCECFARALEQYHAMETGGDNAKAFFESYIQSPQYVSKETFDTDIKPMIERFFTENDQLLKALNVEF